MDSNKMKSMVVLKDLPSNIVDEAIVILKPNVKLKSISKINKDNKKDRNKKIKENKEDKKDKDHYKKYIINEAEMLISDYIQDIEDKKKKNLKVNLNIEKKYKRLKLCFIIFAVLFFSVFFIR